MDVRWISADSIVDIDWSELPAQLDRDDGIVWVEADMPDPEVAGRLAEQFGLHALATRDIQERSYLPKLHAYPDHLFVVLHGPETGEAGHVHLVELDQFIGRRYLVTTHGPLGSEITTDVARRDTRHVLGRLWDGKARVSTPFELSYAIVSAMAHRHGTYLGALAAKVAALEDRVRRESGDPVDVLDEMFQVRHELLSIRTVAAESREVFARMAVLTRMIPPEAPPLIQDLVDRFDRIRALCDDEREFADGAIEFYQARTTTRMNLAMERLALIAAVVLPVTAIASIYGMNIIVGDRTDVPQLAIVLGLMLGIAGFMLAWARRHGWW